MEMMLIKTKIIQIKLYWEWKVDDHSFSTAYIHIWMLINVEIFGNFK